MEHDLTNIAYHEAGYYLVAKHFKLTVSLRLWKADVENNRDSKTIWVSRSRKPGPLLTTPRKRLLHGNQPDGYQRRSNCETVTELAELAFHADVMISPRATWRGRPAPWGNSATIATAKRASFRSNMVCFATSTDARWPWKSLRAIPLTQ